MPVARVSLVNDFGETIPFTVTVTFTLEWDRNCINSRTFVKKREREGNHLRIEITINNRCFEVNVPELNLTVYSSLRSRERFAE